MNNIIFVNPQLIARIDKKVDKLMVRWDYPKDQRFQLFEMVATIELGYAKKTFYWEDGLVCDGWNGYRSYTEKNDPNPYHAWQGFYRSEPHQMVGWSVYMIAGAEDKKAQEEMCRRAYGYDFHWEDEPMIWGYRAWQDFYTEDEAAQAVEALAQDKHVISISNPKFLDMSWMWRIEATSTRKKPDLKNVYKERVSKEQL